jgi:hypothetical protein
VDHRIFAWCIGTAVFAHTISFFGVSYYDQTIVFWYSALAMAASLYNLGLAGQASGEVGAEGDSGAEDLNSEHFADAAHHSPATGNR